MAPFFVEGQESLSRGYFYSPMVRRVRGSR